MICFLFYHISNRFSTFPVRLLDARIPGEHAFSNGSGDSPFMVGFKRKDLVFLEYYFINLPLSPVLR